VDKLNRFNKLNFMKQRDCSKFYLPKSLLRSFYPQIHTFMHKYFQVFSGKGQFL